MSFGDGGAVVFSREEKTMLLVAKQILTITLDNYSPSKFIPS